MRIPVYRLIQSHRVSHVDEILAGEAADPRDLCTHLEARVEVLYDRDNRAVYLAHVPAHRTSSSQKVKPHPKSAH